MRAYCLLLPQTVSSNQITPAPRTAESKIPHTGGKCVPVTCRGLHILV